MTQTCPDRQLLSVYFDGELPSPWKEKMESHITTCPSCSERLETYKSLSVGPAQGEEETVKAAQNRVWQKMEGQTNPQRAVERRIPSGSLWERRVSIPIPAAAAAALLLIALAFVWVIRTPDVADNPGMALVSEIDFEAPDIIHVSDIEDVLQYLGSYDTNEMLIIRLPESRNFVSYGEPAIIRAADYSRQVTNQQMPGRRRQ